MKIPYLSSNPDSEHPSPLLKRKAANLTLHIASSCDASLLVLLYVVFVKVCVYIIRASKQVASIHQKASLGIIFFKYLLDMAKPFQILLESIDL